MDATAIPVGTRLRNIARRRSILSRLIGGDLKVKYEGSTLGYVWSILEPLLLTGVYFFVFSIIGRFGEGSSYALFLISGILPWMWLMTTARGATKALVGNAKLITKVYLPREIFPLSVVGAKTIEFTLSLIVLVFFAAVLRQAPSVWLAAFPLAMALQLMLLTGFALLLSVANTMLRDVERIMTPLLRILMYMSPLFYPLHLVMSADIPHVAKILYRLNPLVGILDLYRAVWFPERFAGWANVGISAAGALTLFVLGWTLFTRLERVVLKEL